MRGFLGVAAAAVAMMAAQPAGALGANADGCVAGPFMVFFDGNSDKITAQGAAILTNAAGAYRGCADGQVMISGHTDRKGTDADNVALSQRMAVNVRKYLVAQGVPDSVITTEAFGETRPLVETADGVSEPQNRRVEVTFGPGSGW